MITWIAAAAHEVPQELGDFGILIRGGWRRYPALVANFVSAATIVPGALLAYYLSPDFDVTFPLSFNPLGPRPACRRSTRYPPGWSITGSAADPPTRPRPTAATGRLLNSIMPDPSRSAALPQTCFARPSPICRRGVTFT